MSHFTIVPANEFTQNLRIKNTNEKGKNKVMFELTVIKGIWKRFANLIYKSAKIWLDKRVGELKAEILMGISKSCNGLIISSNEKFITLKVSWPSWTDFVGVLEREPRDVLFMEFCNGLGFDPHLWDALTLYIIFIILIQYPFLNQMFCDFGVYYVGIMKENYKDIRSWVIESWVFNLIIIQNIRTWKKYLKIDWPPYSPDLSAFKIVYLFMISN